METILLKAESVTPKYIKQLKEKYNLSWGELHRYCNYDANGNALLNAVRDPEKYLTPLMQKKILRGVAKLMKERGDIHHVEGDALPKRFNVKVLNKQYKDKSWLVQITPQRKERRA